MASLVSTNYPTFDISETAKGWRLVIENEDCSVMQVFRSASSARLAVDRLTVFFETMSTQAPGARQAA